MHQKLTKNGKFSTQNNQLQAKIPVELKDNFTLLTYLLKVLVSNNVSITKFNEMCSKPPSVI